VNRYQQGFNLISLMVGMTLSLISIMAMLTLYKNLVSNAAIATQDARQDGQVASATPDLAARTAKCWLRYVPRAEH